METSRSGLGDVGKGRRIGAGHPDLRADRCQRVIERGAAQGIEMRHDLVEQHHRRIAGHVLDEMRMRQRQPYEHRLLFAGRGVGCGDTFAGVHDFQIGAMRPF